MEWGRSCKVDPDLVGGPIFITAAWYPGSVAHGVQTLQLLRELGSPLADLSHTGRYVDIQSSFGNRSADYNLSFDTTWQDQGDDERIVGWTRNAWSTMQEVTGGGVYLNFAGLGEESDSLVRAAHGRNYDRLREIKDQYDPQNLFSGNINIAP